MSSSKDLCYAIKRMMSFGREEATNAVEVGLQQVNMNCERLGGKLQAASKYGVGTNVKVSLPRRHQRKVSLSTVFDFRNHVTETIEQLREQFESKAMSLTPQDSQKGDILLVDTDGRFFARILAALPP